MRNTIIFKKLTPCSLPQNYRIYLDSFLCNCIKAGDCRLTSLISSYTKDYNSLSRPFNFSNIYKDSVDGSTNKFSDPNIIKITFSSNYPEVIEALRKGINGKIFEAHNVKLKVVDIITPTTEYEEELFSFS